MEKLPLVLVGRTPLSLKVQEDEQYSRHRHIQTFNGVEYLLYNAPAFIQQVGRQEYKDHDLLSHREFRIPSNVGYISNPADYVSNWPYVSMFKMAPHPKRRIPALTCTAGGTLVVAGAAVWCVGKGGYEDKKYADRLMPSKEHIQQALANAQGTLHWGTWHKQEAPSVLDDLVTDRLCKHITHTVSESDNSDVQDWVRKNLPNLSTRPSHKS
jgi:hypothetical protein